jgi:hypothetical protein
VELLIPNAGPGPFWRDGILPQSRTRLWAGFQKGAGWDATLITGAFPRTYGQPLLEFEERAEAAGRAPGTVGVVFCGRQAPGGHNIVSGLFDAVSAFGGKLLGFVAGTRGLLAGQAIEVSCHGTPGG